MCPTSCAAPLPSIRGFVEGMEDGTIPPQEHGKYLHIVGDEPKRLSKLINDLLSLSRLERDGRPAAADGL